MAPARTTPVSWHEVLRDPVHWLAFGFGTGLLPGAPGTWGSLLAVFLYWWLPPLPLPRIARRSDAGFCCRLRDLWHKRPAPGGA